MPPGYGDGSIGAAPYDVACADCGGRGYVHNGQVRYCQERGGHDPIHATGKCRRCGVEVYIPSGGSGW